jgi:phytoene desaturase
MRVVVVGAGLGGLAAAAYLLRDHHQVTVLEATERPGGRVGLIERDGFRLDTGPAVLTMPELLADVFAAAGARMEDHLRLTPVDPMYRMVFADGSELRVRHGRPAMTEEIRAFSGPESAAAFERFADWLTALYHAEMPDFIDAQYDSAFDLLRRWRAALRLVRLGGFRRLGGRVASFFDDERLQRAFSFQSLYAGIAPSRALALYAVITYMDSVAGVWTPVGGMHAMASALAAAVEAGGATIRYDARVVRILRSGGGGAVTGVELADGAVLPTETVVCNADLPVAYRTLLEGVDAPRVARRGQYSPSCLLWVAGVRGRPPPGAAHHNVHIGREWDESFRAIIHDGVQMPDPSILVTLHSLDDATLAPPGCSTLYVLEPVPNLDGRVDWAAQRAAATRRLRRQVAAAGYPTDVVTEEWYDPRDWAAQGMERGTPFALAHTFRQTGPFRPRNVDRHVPGLVFAGSSTVPGVGVPMVLLSGKLAAERVTALDRKVRVRRAAARRR